MSWDEVVIVCGMVAAAINAGAFFAFSNFVMPGLADLPPKDGASAMQAINLRAPTPLFVGTIVGAGVVTAPAALVGEWGSAAVSWVGAGVALSLASLVVTVAANVPRNDALAEADEAGLVGLWADYLVSWTRWNTIRTLTSAVSVVTFAVALAVR